jgi:hypothetical protein
MAQTTRRTRLDPQLFDLPVEKMRAGWYSDAYFNHTRDALLQDGRHPHVVMQVFQKRHAWLGGMDEAIAILELCSDGFDGLEIRALYDGDRIEPYEPVLHIEGDYTTFAHLETAYLGTLARRTLVTTNVVHVLQAANGKPVIFMPARHDHHRVQAGDGYAAHVAGQVMGAEIAVTSDEQSSWWGGRGIGTVPHALIAAYGGDTVLAAALAVRGIRESNRIRPLAQELLSGLLSLGPAVLALRGTELAAYHGAEHISIGRYEHGDGAQKEHERCGGHLVGPLVATTAIGNVLANFAPLRMRTQARAAAQFGAVAASTEIFGWMARNPDNLVSQALSRPGHELQHRLSTAEPSAEQLEVAEAALAACLALEHGAR